MLSSSLDTLLKGSKTTYPKKLFAYDCVTLYVHFEYAPTIDIKQLEEPAASDVNGARCPGIQDMDSNRGSL